jgi:hypothetical protein
MWLKVTCRWPIWLQKKWSVMNPIWRRITNKKTQPIQWTERPTGALVAASSLWPDERPWPPNKKDPESVVTNQTNLTLKSYCVQQHFLHWLRKGTWLGSFNERFKTYASVFFFFGFGRNFVNLFWLKNLGTFWIQLNNSHLFC